MFNVLVVDDEKEIRDAIEIYLRGESLKVFKAEDGLMALDILEQEKIHLIILDVMDAYRDWETDRKSTRLNSSHITRSRMPSSA